MNSKLKNKNILVTGGAGFIGSHLVDKLLSAGARHVVIIDNMFLGDENNLSDAIKKGGVLYKDDAEILSSLEYIFDRHNIDIVFNCATKALNYSFVNPSNAFESNVKVILNLLELQRKGAFKKLCHFSTSEVYGTAVYEPMDEDHPRNPTTTYAAGKAAADVALQSYVKMFGLDAVIVRPFNNYGPRQNYRGNLAAVIPVTIYRILNKQKPEIHGAGEQSRDFIFVMDTVDAVIGIMDKLMPGESVNISAHNTITIKDLIFKISEMMDYNGEIVYKKTRTSDVARHNGCNKKFMALIDLQLTDFKNGLSQTIDWYRNI